MKRRWFKIAALLAVGGFVVAASGLVPIKASSGHWAITTWFLQFSKRRSVATHTLALTAPPLDNPDLVLRGAGHYETGCRPCHGSPDSRPRIPQQMTPPPPSLQQVTSEWEPDELFYIVKHGIKFTGMPAWPAHGRDDEVWAMVAFLQQLPSLDARTYSELAAPAEGADVPDPMDALVPPQDVPATVRESCVRCHGRDGRGRGTGAFPKLAGQQPAYLLGSLEAYARGERHSGIMQPASAPIDREEMRQIAEYYARMDPGGAEHAPAAGLDLGRTIATQGLPDRLVPACIECHGPTDRARNPHYPRLSGQYADYLELQLTLFKSGARGGTAYAPIMRQVAAQLTDEQMRAVALYFASVDPRSQETGRSERTKEVSQESRR